MNTTKFSVMDASKAFKKSRTTIYEAIKNGDISRDSDGLIDLSELIRVYGNPIGVQSSTRTEHVHKGEREHVQSEVELLLKEQIALLKNQLDIANQREKSLMQHIEDLTYRIEFKGKLDTKEIDDDSSKNEKFDETVNEKKENNESNKRIVVALAQEEEPKKRGFWSKFFLPNG